MTVEQLPLFPVDPAEADSPDEQDVGQAPGVAPGEEPGRGTTLNAQIPLSAAIQRFREHLEQHAYAENTVKSFVGDLRILKRHLKQDLPVGQISTQRLEAFLHWLQHDRGVPCSPKSYARRLTTLKAFFSWLKDVGVLPTDPAAPIAHKPVQVPLPQVLSDGQVEQVLDVTRQMITGDRPDPRPHLLVTLILDTGMKKQECMGIRLAHIDTSNPAEPAVWVRYNNPRQQHKERRLRLGTGWAEALAAYRKVYEPEDALFACTARNLEYVLADVARQADLAGGLSFETLRWTCAVRDYRARMDGERLRRKLGLSMMSWRETEPKIIRLAEPPL